MDASTDNRALKPGIKTSEFWATAVFPNLIAAVTAIMAMFGHTFDGNSLQPLVPAFAVAASGICTAAYSHSRARVKNAALNDPSATGGVG